MKIDPHKVESSMKAELDPETVGALFDLSPTIVCVAEIKTASVVYANRATHSLLAYTVDELKAMGGGVVDRLFHPEDRAKAYKVLSDLSTASDDRTVEEDFRVLHRNGEWRTLRAYLRPYTRDEAGLPVLALVVLADVTEKARSRRELEASEERYRSIIEHQKDLIVRWTPSDGVRTFANKAYRDFLGGGECVGTSFFPLISEQQREALLERIGRATPDEPISSGETDLRLPDGRLAWIEWTDLALFDEEGRLVEVQAVGRDVSERKRTERDLRERESRCVAMFEMATTGMALLAMEGRFLQVNGRLCESLGYAEEELLGMNFRDVAHPEDLAGDLDEIGRFLGTGADAYTAEHRFLRKDGEVMWAEVSVALVRGEGNDPLYCVSQMTDLSRLKRAQAKWESAQIQMAERVKELATLHAVGELLQETERSVPELLKAVADRLPQGWQSSSVAAARIVFDRFSYSTPGFTVTPWMQMEEFRSHEGREGRLEVAYLEERPAADEGPFLNEERHLLFTVAQMLGSHLGRREAELRVQRQLEQMEGLHRIDSAIVGGEGWEPLLNTVLEQVMERLGAHAANILLLKEDGTLEFAAGRGFRTSALRFAKLRMGEGYGGEVAADRRFLTVRNIGVERKDPRDPHLRAEGLVCYNGAPLIAKGKVLGVLGAFHRSAFEPDDDWIHFFKMLAGQAAIAINSLHAWDGMERSNRELERAYDATLEGWTKALDLRDKETENHSRRVTELTVRLAKVMGFPEAELLHIRRGALLHDVGKLGIPDNILLKPGPLDPDEWRIMRTHAVLAYEWLSPIDYLRPAISIPHHHHEKWDGTGYPDGLKGEEIPLPARMFAVVDVYDALSSDRPYRKAWPRSKVLKLISEEKGKHFDPRVADAFGKMILEEGANELGQAEK